MKTEPILNGDNIAIMSEPSVLPIDFVQNLIDNYRSNQLQAINKEMQTTDAHSIWFSLEKLKKLINDIETETQKVDSSIGVKELGIRFYYAAYPKIEDWTRMEGYSIPDTYAGKHTLVMIPTLNRQDEQGNYFNFDFNPLDQNSYTEAVAGKGKGKGKIIAMAAKVAQQQTIADNHGTLSPPADPKAELF
ncbi:hypothetical protein ACM39_09355 [Chryseobacterium sp. FH2]|uniref:hypothetical protein n=1 Tax=Chryseobacterium sp. FH2 TaxID=1674291 RepID=UPI00065AE5AD|nr:hypothetical protein [Chryseobacterium sp. FH2]KMQ68059.1 hypothetical protein ACM39_09355 [Chryseobacterium sp. FH2]